jgi:hypothetical protein
MAHQHGPAAFRTWLAGTRPAADLLPGRPMAASTPHQPRRNVRAVCCSGGGIRAAAFTLGGIQALGRRPPGKPSWYEDVDLVTAVSGGSYMAASVAIVDHHLTPEQRAEALPYAPGSPEDNRLRAHTRYLVEDPKVAAIGALNVLYGLLLNLLPLLAMIFISAKLLGSVIFKAGILAREQDNWYVQHASDVGVTAVVVASCGVLLFAIERLHDVYRPPWRALTDLTRAWALRLMVAAAVIALALLAVPAALHELTVSRIDFDPRGLTWGAQLGGFVATASAIVGLVKGSVGRFRATLDTTSGKSGLVAGWTSRAVRWLAPWAGSTIAVAVLLIAFLSWTTSAAYDGLQWPEGVAMGLAAVGMLVWQACTDVNRNSVHPFYKERLSSAFAVHRVDGQHAEELRYDRPIRLSDFASAIRQAPGPRRPELVVCAAVNTDEEGVVPAGRRCAPFTFSPQHIGISAGTMFRGEATDADPSLMRPTRDYEEAAGTRLVTVPAAVAVSGAAVSPAMGRMTRAPLRLLLGLANVRLGLWLPNPRRTQLPAAPVMQGASAWRLVRWQLRQPGVRSLLCEMLGRTGLQSRWIYVTDGGHYENLGLVEALRRGATEIIAFDASGDAPHSWTAFGEAVETARADLGVQIDLDPTPMAPPKGSDRAPTMAVKGVCTYPDGARATLVLCKLALPADAPASWDVAAWAAGHPSFPHDTTAQQLYGDREFEAYRRLGELGGERALALLERPEPAELPLPRHTTLTIHETAPSSV